MSGLRFYSSMRPRTQATLDLVLYIVFFLPGIAACSSYLATTSRIASIPTSPPTARRSTIQSVIPIAGALIMLQGIAEIVRCVSCLQTGE